MKHHLPFAIGILILALSLPDVAYTHDTENAHSTGCLPNTSLNSANSVCSSCHKDAPKKFILQQKLLCTTYCLNCHTKGEMDRHHTVDVKLSGVSEHNLYLTSARKISCITCHDLSQPRYDTIRWKSTSLFERLFQSEERYKTYFLSMKNDLGQLCLTCH